MNREYVTFGEALEALREGKVVFRKNWEETGMFVFQQLSTSVKSNIVPKMQSLPDSVKEVFQKRFDNPDMQIKEIYYGLQLSLVNSSNLIVTYIPSIEDLFCADWVILE
jgi:hypothetical protein